MASQSNLALLSGQIALGQAMDVTANNIANISTSGFKRQGIQFNTYLKTPESGGGKGPTAFIYDRATYRDTSNGAIVNTGNPLDLGIKGQGYFQVQMPDGSTAYTRNGSFTLNQQGELVTQSGLPVIADGGTVTIPDTATQINISQDGFISARVDNGQSLAQIGKITLAKFANEQQMQATGDGLYTTAEKPQQDTDSTINQFALEQSNVQPVTEITDMIRIMRSYEQASNMISNENQRQTNAVTRLSSTTAS